MIKKRQKNERNQIIQDKQQVIPPKSAAKIKKQEDTLSCVDLTDELEKCKLAMKGPYLDREENRKLR